MTETSPVHELRVALRVPDFDAALAFYAATMGLPEVTRYDSPEGRVAILAAGRATLELLSVDQVEVVDRMEVGRPVSGDVRLAFEVGDSIALAQRLVDRGATRLGEPVLTPWSHRNVRVQAPDGMHLTLFTPEPPDRAPADTADVRRWLDRAIDLALANVDRGQLPFGAVAVRGAHEVATGVNSSVGDRDPTAHAETAAIRAAVHALGSASLEGITVVASAEPCPMCVAAAALCGVDRIVFAAPRGLAARYGFVLPSAAAALGAAWDSADLVVHAPHPRADAPFIAHADRVATAGS
jgi:lactoylglutathione lyase